MSAEQLLKAYTGFSNRTKKTDAFYVEFLGFPENISNVLGRQVKSIQRPPIRFEEDSVLHRGNQYKEKGFARFNPVAVTFFDDENCITSSILYAQVFRQLNKYKDIKGLPADSNYLERTYRFDVKVSYLNPNKEVTESFILKGCFINEIEHEQSDIADDDDSMIITVTLAYDNIESSIFDDYVEMLSLAGK